MRYRGLRRALPPIVLGLLAGCATGRSDLPANGCAALPLAAYAPAVEARVAGELGEAAPDAAWPGMVADYGRLRAAVRACQAVRP